MSWNEFLKETNANIAKLQAESPDTMAGFNAMGKAAKTNGALDEKTKEFIALGIAIVTRCDSCIGFHVKSLVRLKATRAELCEALAMAAYMGGGPSIAFSAKALAAYDEFAAA
ncbi:alkylhydroperoxidase AhpD family core domain-containing protein [Cognatiyoonia koreensis]|uniref:Alkylhydroperoxidase AhpD family core domain-containing protein n=1 Tax=Cognatiyoonia koreensis TaxID=364200 RepID=A0A1I0P3N5_9RHOB|nr:carboxymuconolactone decarboxylase family protein [Cognatiyoonia koreensis]SEW08832.1 alkylhydroperoxidase AhpD family core domain-containing protein [Cognatiyoonia koreensis]